MLSVPLSDRTRTIKTAGKILNCGLCFRGTWLYKLTKYMQGYEPCQKMFTTRARFPYCITSWFGSISCYKAMPYSIALLHVHLVSFNLIKVRSLFTLCDSVYRDLTLVRLGIINQLLNWKDYLVPDFYPIDCFKNVCMWLFSVSLFSCT